MQKLTEEQEKALLRSVRFVTGQHPNRQRGHLCGFTRDAYRRLGAVVQFPNRPRRSFFVVNPQTLKVEDAGDAPPPNGPRGNGPRAI